MWRSSAISLAALIVVGVTLTPALAEASSRAPSRPVIASISPTFGSAAGQTPVTLRGAGFAVGTDRSRVHFGNASVWARCLSSTECLAFAPAGKGAVRVTIETRRGSSRASSLTRFNYVTPLSAASWTIGTELDLSTTSAEAGTAIPGSLVVTNPGPAVFLPDCGPEFAVALTNNEIPLRVAFSAVACVSNGMLIKSGTSSYPFVLQTAYGMCTQNASQATVQDPFCGSPPIDPPLPAGQYQAEFVSGGFGVPSPTPVAVTVIAVQG